MPIAVTREKVVLGFNSGIARGMRLYRPEGGGWSFTFLRYTRSKLAQMSELIQANGLWIAALGTPQALLVSNDLKLWYPMYIEGYQNDFNYNMNVRAGEGLVVGTTGSALLLLRTEEIVAGGTPVKGPYSAFLRSV